MSSLPWRLRAVLILIAALIAMTAGLWAVPAMAQKKPLPKASILVLNYQKVLRNSTAANSIRKQISEFRLIYRKKFKAEEVLLRKEEERLRKQKLVLAPAAFAKKRKEFEAKVLSLQRRAQKRGRQIDDVFSRAMAEIQNKIVPIVRALTIKMSANLVIDDNQILFASKAFDVTDKVIATLNKTWATVKIEKIKD